MTRKRYKDLTDEERKAFTKELSRMYIFGSACLLAAARNIDSENMGEWPPISIDDLNFSIQVSICDALTFMHEVSRESMIREFISKSSFTSGLTRELVEDFISHESMHNAFCLGVAAVSLMEMNFGGTEEIMQNFHIEDDDAE